MADKRPNESPLSQYPPELMRFVQRLLTRALRDLGTQNGHVPTVAGLDEFLKDLDFAGETNIAKLPARAVPPSWVAVAEAADLARCSPQWIRRKAKDRRITGHKVGQNWILERQSAEDYARGRRERERGSGNG